MNTKRILLFAAIHFAVLAITFTVSFSRSMARFDDGIPATLIESLLDRIVDLLAAPIFWIAEPRITGDMGTVVEWLIIALNSLLWGSAIEYVYIRIRRIDRYGGK